MNERIVELDGGWLQVKVPLPYSLKWVNAYLLPEGDSGWTVIDPGLRLEETEVFWEEVMRSRNLAWGDIARIVVTHHHPDHYGMAGWFQERAGAPVWMSPVAHSNANRLWGDGETFSEQLTAAFLRHGLAGELEDAMRAHLTGFRAKVSPHPSEVRLLSPGETFSMGGVEWDVHGGEGHAPGHLLFHDRTSGRLIGGDQVLTDISPNIGWMPGGDPDPLLSFLDSLRRLRALEVSEVFPGHRSPFARFRERIDELLDHHGRRMNKMAELIGERELTAFEVCELLFGARLRDNAHNLRFALAETIAHLVRMEAEGTVVRAARAGASGEATEYWRLERS
ncbi:glyoxylase-like metal-dependent hydrolase (beta-lactamase superfamily II) [Cohnella sp. SGD-V74]|uniref:MBL fold metallo-hydrolase n=1 Tax=unclassified Cohnella TaxID=2636738 RepID=UPI000B8C4FC7|nr:MULTISPECIES: MBL fold metallo-hydrolase [unclassified Cohnella]PRX71222.1 glyoxylase-like metal-dependent hydrolase (beta-lactamase superfamily II) [Cohnella sp. SGD-V74]